MQYAFGNLAKQNQKASSSQPAQLQHQQQQQQLQKQENKKKQKKQSQHSNHRNSPEDSDSVSDNGMTTDSNTDDNISSSWSIVSSDSLDDFNDIVSTDGYSTDSADNEASEDSSDLATNLEDTVTDIKNIYYLVLKIKTIIITLIINSVKKMTLKLKVVIQIQMKV
ncbi:unnamed protein product [[Candida] boidinii]|nr:unnamed protein product [[Candida] boidinii]